MGNAQEMGDYLRDKFKARIANDQLLEIRGRGLMLGLVTERDCPELMAKAVEHKLLLNVTAGNVIRLLPPLNLTQDEADQIIDIVCALIEQLD